MFRLTLSTLSFAHSYRLIIGIVLIFLFLWTQKKYKKTLNFAFIDLLPKTKNNNALIRNLLISSILLISCVFLAKPQRVNDSQKIQKNGIDIVLALDISASMNADDIPPNRIEIAKQVLQKFLSSLKTDRIGMVVFAGKPFVSVPLTFDYHIFEDILKRTSTNSINQHINGLQGTAIGDALLSALKILEKGTKKEEEDTLREQVIILITDGAANAGVEPTIAAQFAVEQKVKIYTIGIGRLEGGSIPYQTPFGLRRQKVEGVDEPTLQEIAKITGGNYRRATDAKTFQEIIEEIAKLEKHDIEMEEVVSYKNTGEALLILLGILGGILRRKEKKGLVLPR